MRTLGRIIVRTGKIAGLYIPLEADGLEPGIYEIYEVLGEIVVKNLGKSIAIQERVDALSIEDVLDNRFEYGLTEAEYKKLYYGADEKYARPA